MPYNPNKAIHPGNIIARTLEREGMTQKNLCERTGLTEKHVSQIINGDAPVTVETSLLLENVLSAPASFWINLEKNYQEAKARIERLSTMKNELSLLSRFPYKELASREYVEQTTNKEKRVENLWKFFGINSLSFVSDTEAVAFRIKPNNKEIKHEHIAAWLRCGELDSKKQVLSEFSESALKDSIHKLKSLTIKSPKEFSGEAVEILNKAGVALVYTPHFAGTGVSGAVRWINNNPVMQLSLFGAYSDIFWFNLFHEIGHLVLHGKKEKFLEFDLNKRSLSTTQSKEIGADLFATEHLIDTKLYKEFVKQNDFSEKAILRFSKDLAINPGIVAGRLCFDKKLNWRDVASLRTRLKFIKK